MLLFYTGFRPDIIQIAACCDQQTYNAYIMPPSGRLPTKITDITGLTVQGSVMCHKGQVVPTMHMKDALQGFIEFIKSGSTLVGHNIKAFDNRVILLHLMEHDLMSEFTKKVMGFTDTLLLARSMFPDRKDRGYRQVTLVSDMLKGDDATYDAHNALGDVKALQKLLRHINPGSSLMSQFTTDCSSTILQVSNSIKTKQNKSTLHCLVTNKVLSDCMAKKVASSGLKLEHLKLAFKRAGVNGVKDLFGEKLLGGGVRVTKSKAIIQRLGAYLEARDNPA